MPLGSEVGLGPGNVVLDGIMGTQLPTERSTAAPTFRPVSIVAKWTPISATAEHCGYFGDAHWASPVIALALSG